VRRLVDAAREVSLDAAVVEALVATTGLTRPGVTLALEEHLETRPSEDELRRLVERAGTAERVHVVLSSNVFVGALRALAVARAASERVTAAPSRRASVFARALVERTADPGLSIDGALDIRKFGGGEIHVYGRDSTIAHFRASAPKGVRVRGHGSGLGIALVTSWADPTVAARALARDVAAFDQRGCLSPRVVLFFGGEGVGQEFSSELDRALVSLEDVVPRGNLEPQESMAVARYADAIAFVGRLWRGKAHLVGLAPKGAPLFVPPSGRHIHIALVESLSDARARIATVAQFVTAVGSDDIEIVRGLVDHPARVSRLGEMQRPPLDGPVDMRGQSVVTEATS
jgi:hypothetical protein